MQVLLFYPDGKRSSSTEGQVNQGGGAAAIAAQPHFVANEAQLPGPVPQDGQAVLPGPHMPGLAQAGELRGKCLSLQQCIEKLNLLPGGFSSILR